MSGSRAYLTNPKELEQCAAKKLYYSKEDAWRAARATGIGCRVYRCPGRKGQQRHFHVTGGKRKLMAHELIDQALRRGGSNG